MSLYEEIKTGLKQAIDYEKNKRKNNMTVKELKEILSTYPEDMKVEITCDRYVRKIIDVNTIIDIDTNIVSVDIMAEDKPSLDKI